MDKAAILINLKEVEKVYSDAIQTLDEYVHPVDLFVLRIKYGICFYIIANYPTNSHLFMMNELKKDFLPNHENFGNYWYTPPNYYFNVHGDTSLIKQNALKPRLEHLQRTIKRLENELKNQPTI